MPEPDAPDEQDPDRDDDRKRHKGDQGRRKATTRVSYQLNISKEFRETTT